MARQRYVLEGVWSGYTSAQSRVCHREVTFTPKRFEHLHVIEYTDGTRLSLSLRKCEPRERVQTIKGYTELINKAILKNESYVKVADL